MLVCFPQALAETAVVYVLRQQTELFSKYI